jgi:hypothetical protein
MSAASSFVGVSPETQTLEAISEISRLLLTTLDVETLLKRLLSAFDVYF